MANRGLRRWARLMCRPFVGIFSHVDELTDNLVVDVIETVKAGSVDIIAAQSELEMHLSFCSFSFRVIELGNEGRCITSLSPGFRKIGADRAR